MLQQPTTTILCDLTHNLAQIAHTHTHTQRDIFLVVVVGIFLSFFFSYSHYKRKGQGPAELTQELINITKIVQFLKISSTLSAFMNRGGDPACMGRVGEQGKVSARSMG